MPNALRVAILAELRRHADTGVTMGALVEGVMRAGFAVEQVEGEVWALLGERRVTPHGFVCRRLRRPDGRGGFVLERSYEFVLIPWSPDQDAAWTESP